MTPPGIETATFRIVAQRLNQLSPPSPRCPFPVTALFKTFYIGSCIVGSESLCIIWAKHTFQRGGGVLGMGNEAKTYWVNNSFEQQLIISLTIQIVVLSYDNCSLNQDACQSKQLDFTRKWKN